MGGLKGRKSGEYLRYNSERYRRYRASQHLNLILDKLAECQYVNGILRYLAMQKRRYFHNEPKFLGKVSTLMEYTLAQSDIEVLNRLF